MIRVGRYYTAITRSKTIITFTTLLLLNKRTRNLTFGGEDPFDAILEKVKSF